MRPRLSHWLAALGLAASLHLGLMLLLDPPRAGARGPGRGGIEIALGPAGGVANGVAQTGAEAAPEDDPPAEPPPQALEPPAPAAPAERSPQPQAVVSRPTEPAPKRQPEPKPEPRPEPKPASERPAPPPAPAGPAEPRSAPAEAADTGTGAAGRAGADPAGAGDATAGGGDPGAAADYLARLRAWLERHRRYPLKARLRRQEGTVRLGFVVDGQGRVLSRRIETGSGHPLLDREALELLRRAEPLPAPPPELGRLELIVPVTFSLR